MKSFIQSFLFVFLLGLSASSAACEMLDVYNKLDHSGKWSLLPGSGPASLYHHLSSLPQGQTTAEIVFGAMNRGQYQSFSARFRRNEDGVLEAQIWRQIRMVTRATRNANPGANANQLFSGASAQQADVAAYVFQTPPSSPRGQ